MPLPRVSLRPAPSAALQRPRVGAASRARRTVCPRAGAQVSPPQTTCARAVAAPRADGPLVISTGGEARSPPPLTRAHAVARGTAPRGALSVGRTTYEPPTPRFTALPHAPSTRSPPQHTALAARWPASARRAAAAPSRGPLPSNPDACVLSRVRRAEAAAPAAGSSVSAENPITLTPTAIKHLTRLRDDNGGDSLCLRMGVKSGGCSGLSYAMDFEDEANIKEDDHVMEQGGIKLVTDPKSLLYLFGMSLDYSTDLIGGGFQFHNPNAESSCGCGKSFGV
ncbi:unnamed protein product [Pedinophyceae sp. YPF-701]|nr:unnamed protein product [Pedinophyceae sp. YPF-701]